MIKHIFIVAIRNLLKYRQQTLISIAGLAIGFVCFALSAYWIRYEMSFDGFHKKADRIYQVRKIDPTIKFGQYINTPPPLAETLEKYFPEITVVTAGTRIYDIEPGENSPTIDAQEISKNFLNVFDLEILSGSIDFNDENGILVSETFAKDHFHTSNPTGKELIQYVGGKEYKKMIVRGVVKDWPKNTNLPFQVIRSIDENDRGNWNDPSITYLLLPKGTNPRDFKEKLEKLQVKEAPGSPSYTIVPLKEAYYTEPAYNDAELKFEQVLLFAILGLLVIIAALFNYLNLYASRIRIRVRELSLRKVTGSSNRGIFILLSTEFILLLAVACILGFIGIEWSLPAFKSFAAIQSDYIHIYSELGSYILTLIGVSILMVYIVIYYTRRQLFQESARMVSPSGRKGLFSKLNLILQMIIGLGFIFCTTIYFKQIHTLSHSDPGLDRSRILTAGISPKSSFFYSAYFENTEQINLIINGMGNISTIEKIMPLGQGAILPRMVSSRGLARTETMNEKEAVEYDVFYVHPDYIRFYGMQLLAGSDFKPVADDNRDDVVINEAMAKALGLKDPVGKTLIEKPKPYYDTFDGSVSQHEWSRPHTIIGVVKNFVYESPIQKIIPVVMSCHASYIGLGIKYLPGTYKQTKESIETFVEKGFPGYKANIFNMDNEYQKHYESEASLRFLLALLSGVCIVISLFGIYSVVALNCEYRRKEIAIRKVNGASLFSVFNLFFKEYILLLAIASVIAFPIGYLIMKPWTERYVLQTEINWWIYALLFLSTAIVVLFTITARVWKTAHINPATELKKE